MTVTSNPPHVPRITRGHANLLLAASIMTTLLVTLGGIVCATESGAGCPDWPGCYGRIVPPPQINAIIEYTHRLVAALTSPLILAAAWVSWRRARSLRWVSRPLALAIPFLLAVIVFGAFAVLTGLPRGVAALDLGSALIVLTLVVSATVAAFVHRTAPELPQRLSLRNPLAQPGAWTLAAVYAVYVSGVLVAGKGSLTRCLGWPMWRTLPDDLAPWLQVVRLGVAAVAALLVVALVGQARRVSPGRMGLHRTAAVAGAAFLVEMGVIFLLMTVGTGPLLLVLRVVAAAVLWSALVVLVVLAAAQPPNRA